MTNNRVGRGSSLAALVALVAGLTLGVPAHADKATFRATVLRTLVTAETSSDGSAKFGGCMAYLSVSPQESGLNCPAGRWVTMSCSGDLTSKSNAMRLFDSAQLAFVTNKTVSVTVDDAKKHNGWCFAARIDVL
jgi:hypothetical protein